MFYTHAAQLRTMISKNELVARKEREDYLDEGRKIRKMIDTEREKIQHIKYNKIDQLDKLDIAEKYKFELKTKKISF